MASAVGNITVLLGAGLFGTILADGSFLDVTKFFSGAFKIVTKHLQHDKDGSKSIAKHQNDSLLAEVNNLRRELQVVASRPLTVVTVGRTGSRVYGVTTVLVIGLVGYCIIRWKGWKLSDFMFVTRRNFTKSCSSVSEQLDTVSSSVSSAEQFLSSRIDRVDITLDEAIQDTVTIKDQVGKLDGRAADVRGLFNSVTSNVEDLQQSLNQVEQKEEFVQRAVSILANYSEHLERLRVQAPPLSGASQNSIAGTSMAALPSTSEPPSPLSSSPPPSSPSSSTKAIFRTRTVSSSGIKIMQEVANTIAIAPVSTPRPSSGEERAPSFETPGGDATLLDTGGASTSGRSGWKLPSFGLLSRTRSSVR